MKEVNYKDSIKKIIEKLTNNTKAILSEKILFEAAENGIGEQFVSEAMIKLLEEKFIEEPIRGVIKRI